MKKILALAALASALTVPTAPAVAQKLAVKNMIALCMRGDVTQGVSDPSCVAYFEGFSNALRVVGQPARTDAHSAACVPEGTTVDQQVMALFQYVQTDAKVLEEPVATGTYKALARAFPCAK